MKQTTQGLAAGDRRHSRPSPEQVILYRCALYSVLCVFRLPCVPVPVPESESVLVVVLVYRVAAPLPLPLTGEQCVSTWLSSFTPSRRSMAASLCV